MRTKDLWGNMNSQETVGISAEMFGEFIYPSYKKLAAEFGLVYFGCCELEIIFRDIYTLEDDTGKPGRAIKIARNMIDKAYSS